MQRAHIQLNIWRAFAAPALSSVQFREQMSARGKRKATKVAAPDIDEDDVVEVEEVEAKKKPAAKKAKATKLTEPCTDALGWEIVPPSLIWRDFGTEPSEKIAAIDMDGTLVNTKTGAQYPVDGDDWRLFNDKVPSIVQGYHKDGYKIVIFSNQGAIKGALDGKAAVNHKTRFASVISKLGVPVQAFMATQKNDPMRKPETGMWTFMTNKCNGGVPVDLKSSFYIGDAAGRSGDHSLADKEFAANVGIEFKLPEDAFGPEDKRAAGGSGGGGPVANEANAAIVKMFTDIADYWSSYGKEDKDKFKASANRKVARALGTFEQPITEQTLKEVGKLAGVGKASIDKIKEFLKTGTCHALEATKNPPEDGDAAGESSKTAPAKPAKPSKDAQVASAFM